MESLKIILFAVLAAVVYGILHDQVTAHLCVEYFTVAHPPVFATQNPFLLAIGWGVIATWWVGLPLGVLLALAARCGKRPKLTLTDLCLPILRLLLVMGLCALLAGLVGAFLAAQGYLSLPASLAQRIPEAKHVAFWADAWAHSASYLLGAAGGLALVVIVWRRRRWA